MTVSSRVWNPALSIAILAAGKGTRMRSSQPKVLHKLGSLSLVERVVQTTLALQPHHCFVIVGYAQEHIRAALADYPVDFVEQTEQLGTGHAVQQLLPYLQQTTDDLLVINADVPLLRSDTLKALVESHQTTQASATILTAQLQDPTGYGRVFCNEFDQITAIIEHRDCTPQQQQNRRVNAGVYCFKWPDLNQVLPQLSNQNQQNEYYLTDVMALLPQVQALDVSDTQEIGGINDRIQLAQAYKILQDRIKSYWMKAGVTLIDPDSITIDDTVQIDPDVIIEPQTHLRGDCLIHTGSHLGPGSLIENSVIGYNCRVLFSTVADSQIGNYTTVGPYANIRQQSQIAEQCRIGNFVEVKKAAIQKQTNAAHLAYLGDALLGEDVNIGAGTVLANYDGRQKHTTIIGNRSKTGANSVLVAPVTVGDDVTIAAGSTINQDLPNDCLAIARSRPVIKPGWRLKSPAEEATSPPSSPSSST